MSWLITPQLKVPVDPYRSQVSLLLHGDGANGSTTITDSSPTPKAVTVAGNAQISTAQSKFGGASLAFDGNSDYMQIATPSDSLIRWNDGDYTLEYWIYPIAFSGSVQSPVVGNMSPATGTNYWSFGPMNDGTIQFYYFSGSTNSIRSTATISLNAWSHLAFVKSGTGLTCYSNGTSVASQTLSGTPIVSNAFPLSIGGFNGISFNGYIDDLRITKGVARYTANFTPPTAPFPDL